MNVIRNNRVLSGVERIIIRKSGFTTIDGVSASPPMTIESQTHVGFYALKDLEPIFKHMKCWKEDNWEECSICPVKHEGGCGIMEIKDAADKEAREKEQNA